MTEKVTYEVVIRDLASKGFMNIQNAGTQAFSGVNNSVQGTQNTLSGLLTKIGLVGGAFAAIQGIKSIGKMGIDAEQTGVAFEVMLKSVDKAKVVLGELKEFAKVTPFNQEDVIKSGRSLLAYQFKAEELIPTLRKVGDVAAGAQVPIAELTAIFGKAKLGGVIQGDDLNQLAGRGIPVFEELAKVMNVPVGSIKKLGEEGKISFSYLDKAFSNMSSEGGMFFNLMDKQSKTVGGRISSLMDGFAELGLMIGNTMLPAIGYIVDFASAVLERTRIIRTAFENVAIALTPITSILNNEFGKALTPIQLASKFISFLTDAIYAFLPIIQNVAVVLSPLIQWVIDFGKAVYVQLAPTLKVISDIFQSLAPYIYAVMDSLTHAVNITYLTGVAFNSLRYILQVVGGVLIFVAKVLTPILQLLISISGYLITGAMNAWKKFSDFVMYIIDSIRWALDGITNTIYGMGEALGIVSKQVSDFDKKMHESKYGKGGSSVAFFLEEGAMSTLPKKSKATDTPTSLSAGSPTNLPTGTPENSIKAGIAGVQGDAKAARNITININNLINTLEVKSGMDLQGIETSVKDSSLKGIMTALRDTSLMAGE
jgi:tape measure domain-containing protein